eukprot:13311256-Alexandrium_andersonii.AAC.1
MDLDGRGPGILVRARQAGRAHLSQGVLRGSVEAVGCGQRPLNTVVPAIWPLGPHCSGSVGRVSTCLLYTSPSPRD